jgi:hypothetical protein
MGAPVLRLRAEACMPLSQQCRTNRRVPMLGTRSNKAHIQNPHVPMKSRVLFLITLLCAVAVSLQSVRAAPITVMNTMRAARAHCARRSPLQTTLGQHLYEKTN